MRRWAILGIDGYLGWTLACHLASAGEHVAGLDSGLRRKLVRRLGSRSAIPIATPEDRASALEAAYPDHGPLVLDELDVLSYTRLREWLRREAPDVVVHLAEQPSATYSMLDQEPAATTLTNNVTGTLSVLWAMRESCPTAHLVKLGGAGDGAGSVQQVSQAAEGDLLTLAVRAWGLRATRVLLGTVCGTWVPAFDAGDAELRTRLDVDECFGTVLHRFIAQAILGEPLTVYGSGTQPCALLPLAEAVALIAALEPGAPECGVIDLRRGWQEVWVVAREVQATASRFGIAAEVRRWTNPRAGGTEFRDSRSLVSLPAGLLDAMLRTFGDLLEHRERLESARRHMVPRARWQGMGPGQEPLPPLEEAVP